MALREETPNAMARLRALVNSPDDRVAMVAVDKVMLYAFGPPPPGGFDISGGEGPVDLTQLTADERSELSVAYASVQRLLSLAADRIGPV